MLVLRDGCSCVLVDRHARRSSRSAAARGVHPRDASSIDEDAGKRPPIIEVEARASERRAQYPSLLDRFRAKLG
jgi:hypothetical protein